MTPDAQPQRPQQDDGGLLAAGSSAARTRPRREPAACQRLGQCLDFVPIKRQDPALLSGKNQRPDSGQTDPTGRDGLAAVQQQRGREVPSPQPLALRLCPARVETRDPPHLAAPRFGAAGPGGGWRQVVVTVRVGGSRGHLWLWVRPGDAAAHAPLHAISAVLGTAAATSAASHLRLSCGGRTVGAGACGAFDGGGESTGERWACVPALRGGMLSAGGGGSRAGAILAQMRATLAASKSVLQTLVDGLDRDTLQPENRSGRRLLLSDSETMLGSSGQGTVGQKAAAERSADGAANVAPAAPLRSAPPLAESWSGAAFFLLAVPTEAAAERRRAGPAGPHRRQDQREHKRFDQLEF